VGAGLGGAASFRREERLKRLREEAAAEVARWARAVTAAEEP
jgi:hypothetical protein